MPENIHLAYAYSLRNSPLLASHVSWPRYELATIDQPFSLGAYHRLRRLLRSLWAVFRVFFSPIRISAAECYIMYSSALYLFETFAKLLYLSLLSLYGVLLPPYQRLLQFISGYILFLMLFVPL